MNLSYMPSKCTCFPHCQCCVSTVSIAPPLYPLLTSAGISQTGLSEPLKDKQTEQDLLLQVWGCNHSYIWLQAEILFFCSAFPVYTSKILEVIPHMKLMQGSKQHIRKPFEVLTAICRLKLDVKATQDDQKKYNITSHNKQALFSLACYIQSYFPNALCRLQKSSRDPAYLISHRHL